MTPSSPKVSVLLPVHDGERFVREAAESILAQSFRDLELLLVDDGSTDGTPAVLDALRDPRIVRLRNDRNLGFARSLNRGLGAARGTYLARMDADDVSLPDRLGEQVEHLDRHPGVGLVATDHAPMDAPDRAAVGRPVGGPEVEWRLLWENPIAHPSVMVRTELLRRCGGYSESFRHYAEDLDLWFRLGDRTELAILGRVLVLLRKHDRNVTVVGEAPHIEEVAALVRDRLGRCLGGAPDDAAVRLLRRLPLRAPATAEDLVAAAELLRATGVWIAARHRDRPAELARIRVDHARRLVRLVRLRVPRPRRQALRLLRGAATLSPAVALSPRGLLAARDALLGPRGVRPPLVGGD